MPLHRRFGGGVYSADGQRDIPVRCRAYRPLHRPLLLRHEALGVVEHHRHLAPAAHRVLPLLPAFARDVLHSGEFGLGWLSTAVGVGALIGALTLAALGHYNRKGLLLTVGNLLFPSSVIGFAFSTSMPLSLALIAVSGFGFMVQNATVNTLIQSRVDDRLRGRVMSVYTIVFQGFFPIGALFAGTVAQHSSIALGAALGAGIALAFGLLLFWRAPGIRALR